MQIVEADRPDSDGHWLRVYPHSPDPKPALTRLVGHLEAKGLPFAVGALPQDPRLLLLIGPLTAVERAQLTDTWYAYFAKDSGPVDG